MWFVKYLLFILNAVLSMVGGCVVVVGILMYLIFDRFLPPAFLNILDFLHLKLPEALPTQLSILGTVVCLSALVGCCGAILDGKFGKWLLITYTVELTTFVALNIFIAVVLHKGHQITSTQGAMASPLVMAPTPELIDPTYSGKLSPLTLSDEESLLRQRRGIISKVVGTAVNVVGTVSGGVVATAEAGVALIKMAKELTEFVLSMFKALNQKEEAAVKWIRPIFGEYTRPVFRLTNSKIIMSAWVCIIGVEIIFILLNIFLITKKNRHPKAKKMFDYKDILKRT